MQRSELLQIMDGWLMPERFKDYCPNGLQVEGGATVTRIVGAVTASQAAVDYAVSVGAQALLVHHGWFWRGEEARVIGIKRRRLGALLAHDINLIAYHLPLDAHPELGNNACLARLLGLNARPVADSYLWVGELEGADQSVADFAVRVERVLGRKPLVLGETARPVVRVALCSGAAQDELSKAVELGADLYLSGEVSERTTHEARENGIAYLSAGHHATERFGVQALLERLDGLQAGLETLFFDDENPV